MNATIAINNSHIEDIFSVTKWYKSSLEKFYEEPKIRVLYPEGNFYTGATAIVKNQIEIFDDLFQTIIEFSPEEAKKKYKKARKLCDQLLKINNDLLDSLRKQEILDSKLSEYFTNSNNNIIEFVKSLKVIAEGEKIDEKDYDDFMSKIAGNERFENVGNNFEEILSKP